MRTRVSRLGVRPALVAVGLALGIAQVAQADVGPSSQLMPSGRQLSPAGRLTAVGNFPSGGALTPDGKFFWAIDSGHGKDDAQVVDIATGSVVQVLPLPGAFGAVAFSPDGSTAYISGEPKGGSQPDGPVTAPQGDAVHVFSIDRQSGRATEQSPIQLPATTGGFAQTRWGAKLGWPDGLAVTPDGKRLVVALNMADQAAIIDLQTRAAQLVRVGRYPDGVAVSKDGTTAYVSNEYDGTVSVIDLTSATPAVKTSIPVGGPSNPDGSADPNRNSHPRGLVVSPKRDELYVAVSNRDLIAVVDTSRNAVVKYFSVQPRAGLGATPTALAISPDGQTLYSADSGEDALGVIDLSQAKLIGRVPTAAYPTGVAVAEGTKQLVWVSAKGFGSGPNPAYGTHPANSNAAPYGSYVLDMFVGRVGVLPTPNEEQLKDYTAVAARQVGPSNNPQISESDSEANSNQQDERPDKTPVIGPDGGPSAQIKHVFYFERENRTYDQIFGSDRRGDGDPTLELFDNNGVAGPSGGVTPNAHALSEQFVLLDHFFADSDVSQDGHKIASSGVAPDFVERNQHPGYSGRGRSISNDDDPAAAPPRDYLFDQAVRQHISFRNYGEYAASTKIDDGRPTWAESVANKDASYPGRFGCDGTPAPGLGILDPAKCSSDSGTIGTATPSAGSRFDTFQKEFQQQLATNSVPAFNYFILPNDHTNGTRVGFPTPKASVADNDYGLGQFVDLISHSPIWSSSAIFVIEDDTQDGADHIDSHRMPAFVISPYVRHGAVVHTRYDQDSMIRTMEMILGMDSLSLFDRLATPMYDVFTDEPDATPYVAIKPTQPLNEVNTPQTAAAIPLGASEAFTKADVVPQEIFDQVLWQSVYGPDSTPPPPGPNASAAEHARAEAFMEAYQSNQVPEPTVPDTAAD